MKVKRDLIKVVLVCFTFYEPSIIPHNVFLLIKYLVILWMVLSYHSEMKTDRIILAGVLGYGGITVLSSVYNRMAFNTIVASVFYAFQVLAVFLVSKGIIKRHGISQYIKWLFGYFICICFLTDASMLFIGYDFSNPTEVYLIGNKFVVSYVHCFTVALAFARIGEKDNRTLVSNWKVAISKTGISRKMTAYVVAVLTIFISAKVTCSTGIVISSLLLVLMFLPSWIIDAVSSGKIMVVAVATINILMFGSYSLLTNPHLLNFVQNVLGKSGNFTGRVQIWAIIFTQIIKKPILGYGYYNDIINNLLGYGNPQNGVLKCLLDTGILGLIAYAFMVLKSFIRPNSDAIYVTRPLIAFFLVMLVASLVEINLTHMLVFLTMAINFYSSQSRMNG